MAKFQIYTYMFRPVMEKQQEIPFEEFEQIDVQESLDRKQELTGKILDNEERLKFEFNDTEYEHETYISKSGIYMFRIANNGHEPQKREFGFKVITETNHPSSLVIIDNRKDRQVIAVEDKGNKSAFKKQLPLTDIIQATLRKKLQGYRLTLDISPKYHTSSFWQVVDVAMKMKGIEVVEFPFPYPNLPVITNMAGEYFADVARRTNSEATLKLEGQNKESVRLNKEDLWVLNAVKACAASGRPILIKPKGSAKKEIGVENPVFEEIPNAALTGLDQKDLFDSKFQAIVEFLNKIKLVYE